jgi:hypothetical protein
MIMNSLQNVQRYSLPKNTGIEINLVPDEDGDIVLLSELDPASVNVQRDQAPAPETKKTEPDPAPAPEKPAEKEEKSPEKGDDSSKDAPAPQG